MYIVYMYMHSIELINIQQYQKYYLYMYFFPFLGFWRNSKVM